jgi:hypothetical protein
MKGNMQNKTKTKAKASKSSAAKVPRESSRKSARTPAARPQRTVRASREPGVANSDSALGNKLVRRWLAEGIESKQVTKIPDEHKRGEAPEKLLAGDETLGTKVGRFEIYFDSSFGSAGQALCDAMAQTVETDYRIYSSWFGGVQVDSFDLHANPGDNGASHFDCGARHINFDWRPTKSANWARMLADAEIVEVFEDNFDGDWDCGNSTGEGLSRALAECIYPGNALTSKGKTPAATWLDGKRDNWVKYNDGTDLNYDSTGCSVLFLNWLRYQLGFHWDDIIGATQNLDDLTLEHLYEKLHDMHWKSPGNGKGWKAFKDFVDAKFPPGHKSNLGSNNPFPFAGSERWGHWTNRGHPAPLLDPGSTPGVAARAVNRLDVCGTGNDDAVWHLSWDGSSWQPWTSMGGDVVGGPAAISRFKTGFDVYATGRDYKMRLFAFYPFSFVPWVSVEGGTSFAQVAAASWAPYRVDCFAIGAGSKLLHRFSNSEGLEFSDWKNLGKPDGLTLESSPTAVSRGPNLLDCFVRASDQFIWKKSWNGTSWADWQKIDLRKVVGSPAVCSWSPNRLDIMVLDNSSNLSHMLSTDSGATWKNGKNLGKPPGTTIFSSPGAVSWGPNRIDCFVICADYSLWHIRWG